MTALSETPTADAHDPLPESNWLWRRLFVFAVTTAILVLIYRYGDRLSDIAAVAVQNQDSGVVIVTIRAMMSLMFWLLSGLFVMITFYMLAPSAEQVIKALQVAKSLRAGVVFSGSKRTTSEGDESTATVTGQPVAPPAALPDPPPVDQPVERKADETLPEYAR